MMPIAGRFRIEPLDKHERADFACGVPALDRYFRQQAGQDHRRRVAIVYVAVDTSIGGAIAGFYSLSATRVLTTHLPEDVARRLPRYPELPAILLGRLAVDARWQGQQLGRLLLTDALVRSARLDQVGALFLLVDAKDREAAGFYARLGFRPLREEPAQMYFVLEELRRKQ
jgi:GNAT superfamily N-acetyltransferase